MPPAGRRFSNFSARTTRCMEGGCGPRDSADHCDARFTMTVRLYLDDPYQREFDAEVTESVGGWCVLSQTLFHPGGGGQPHDRGQLLVRDSVVPVSVIRED